MKHWLTAAAAAGIVMAAGGAWAEECAFDYPTFESTVPHFDLDECPDAVEEADGGFCRASIHMDILTVWVFEDEGSMCFRRVQQFFDDDYEVVIR
jgi:hypothetical protein